MTRLALDAAPETAVPRRFLETAPIWGALAGVLLLAAGSAALRTRWHPATLAATHAFTLGVFGNLLFGSLLQFLPAVAGARVRGGRRAARLLHALLNLGTLLLVIALYGSLRALFAPASVLLFAAFGLFAGMTVPGLLAAHGQRLLRAGLGLGIAAALATAALGAGFALTLAGWIGLPWPMPALVDVHALLGLLGWVLVILVVVGRMVMPMFQGAATLPAAAAAAWLAGVATALPLASITRLVRADRATPYLVVVAATVAFAFGVLWLQARSTHRRNPPLRAFWRAGTLALLAATIALPVGDGLLAGVLAIGVALPLLTCGMQLEIVAFLGWIDLHRRCGRGTRLPSVQRLLPNRERWRVLACFLAVALLLPAAVQWPSSWLAAAAALALIGSRVMLWRTLRGVRHRATRFLAEEVA
ncbi:hypothetical protein [Dokdonella sp.]|uniref:hypothetical protein n=1 Tax=Dokdonella sp. TaxID=2291710 RepID=UPI0037846B05